VTAGLLESALRLLADGTVDAVLGRAAGGSFWLLGLQRPDKALVPGVPLSTARTGGGAARQAGGRLRVARLPCHVDVDNAADADAVARQIPGSRFAAVLLAVYPACLGETMDGNAGRGRRASARPPGSCSRLRRQR
jgi:glycosyltransferase A (GT-A) superfamily protein (DUF2064 family)